MLKFLKKADSVVERIQTYACAVAMFAMMWLVFFMVFFRYALNDSITWAEEVLRYADMWVILLGVGLTTRVDQNVSIDLLQSLFEKTPKIRAIHYVFTRAVVAVFMLCMLGPAFELISKSSASHATSLPWLYMSAVYWAFPVGVFSIVLSLCGQVPRKVKEILSEGKNVKAKELTEGEGADE